MLLKALSICLFLILKTPFVHAQIVNIEEQRITGLSDSVHWYGYLKGGGALTKVQQQSLQLNFQTKVEYKSNRQLALLLLNLKFLRAGNQDFARNAFAHLRYNYKLTDSWTWEAFMQVQTSPIQLLEQRRLAGTGIRYRLLKSNDGRQRMYLGAALISEQNMFSGETVWRPINRSSNYISMTFRPGKQVTLVNTTYWQPVLGLIKNYRLSTEWVLKLNITQKLAFHVDFDYSIDKNLPTGAPGEVFAWRNGIALQL